MTVLYHIGKDNLLTDALSMKIPLMGSVVALNVQLRRSSKIFGDQSEVFSCLTFLGEWWCNCIFKPDHLWLIKFISNRQMMRIKTLFKTRC